MTFDDLAALGVTSVGGALDYKNQCIGMLTPDGPVLTPEGQALVASLGDAPAARQVPPVKARKTVKAVLTPEAASDADDVSLSDMVDE